MIRRKNPQGRKARFNLVGMYLIGIGFCVLAVALIMVQTNVRYTVRLKTLSLLPREELIEKKNAAPAEKEPECLLVFEEGDELSHTAREAMEEMLREMNVPYALWNAGELREEHLSGIRRVLLAVTHYQLMPDMLLPLQQWVRDGGDLMVLYPPAVNGSFMTLSGLLGIKENAAPARVNALRFREGFLLGGAAHDFELSDAYDSSMGFSLTEDCRVFLESTDEYPVPVIWRRQVGEGSVVVYNSSIIEKGMRGIQWGAYTLSGDYTVYPVINGAAFYIDDFPAPVPEGSGIYILRDYGMSIADFLTRVWWTDVYNAGRNRNILYTGLVIESYNNVVEGEYERNRDTSRFLYYGNMILRSGGEIGIHGYNHMPLVPESFVYMEGYESYRPWPSTKEMTRAVREVMSFTASLFPEEKLQTYVPPSNIISREGLNVLANEGIRSVAAVYLEGEHGYEQEFDIDPENGIINTPRIISGYMLDPYMQLTALSELNYHLVSSHFQHPDDILDEDRGAALGWETLLKRYKGYINWLYTSVPQIRNLTGAEMAGAVQRFDLMDYTAEETDRGLELHLSNRLDSVWMMLRLNRGQEITGAEGARWTKLEGDLYLLECVADHVIIEWTGEN